jgi:hypothetical protein
MGRRRPFFECWQTLLHQWIPANEGWGPTRAFDPRRCQVKTAWGTTTVVGLNTYFGPARGGAAAGTPAAPAALAVAPAASGRRRQLLQGLVDPRLLAAGSQFTQV